MRNHWKSEWDKLERERERERERESWEMVLNTIKVNGRIEREGGGLLDLIFADCNLHLRP